MNSVRTGAWGSETAFLTVPMETVKHSHSGGTARQVHIWGTYGSLSRHDADTYERLRSRETVGADLQDDGASPAVSIDLGHHRIIGTALLLVLWEHLLFLVVLVACRTLTSRFRCRAGAARFHCLWCKTVITDIQKQIVTWLYTINFNLTN